MPDDREDALRDLRAADETHRIRSALGAAADETRAGDVEKALGEAKPKRGPWVYTQDRELIDRAFTTYQVPPDHVAAMDGLLTDGKHLAVQILEAAPAGRERRAALEHLELAIMYARTAVARGHGQRNAPPGEPASVTVVLNGQPYQVRSYTVGGAVGQAVRIAGASLAPWLKDAEYLDEDGTILTANTTTAEGRTYTVATRVGWGG